MTSIIEKSFFIFSVLSAFLKPNIPQITTDYQNNQSIVENSAQNLVVLVFAIIIIFIIRVLFSESKIKYK